MTSLFLTREELRELTGYKMLSAQKRWLARKRFTYITGADGVPRVLRQALLARYKIAQDLPAEPVKEPQLRF